MEMEINVVAIEVPSAKSMRELSLQRKAEIIEMKRLAELKEIMRQPQVFCETFDKVMERITNASDNGYTSAEIVISDNRNSTFYYEDWVKVGALVLDSLKKGGYCMLHHDYCDSWRRKSGKVCSITIKW